MDYQSILGKCDHTLLKTTATSEDIKQILDECIKYNCATAMIPPSYVKEACDYSKGKVAVATVIGFPNGYNTTATKVFETKDAIANGAVEIDMVANISQIKNANFDFVLNEIKAVKEACGQTPLKVIIETCLLTEAEKIKMCQIVTEAKADYIKTSTGFSTAGATFADIELFAKNVGENVKLKAAGGIKNFDDAEKFVDLGCSRLGTSRLVKIMEAKDSDSNY